MDAFYDEAAGLRPDHFPVPPKGCICASFYTVRGTHKSDCPLSSTPTQTGFHERGSSPVETGWTEELRRQMTIRGLGEKEADYLIENVKQEVAKVREEAEQKGRLDALAFIAANEGWKNSHDYYKQRRFFDAARHPEGKEQTGV